MVVFPTLQPLSRDEAFAVVADFFRHQQYRTGRLTDTASVSAFFGLEEQQQPTTDDAAATATAACGGRHRRVDASSSDSELQRFSLGGGWYDGRNVSFGTPMVALARWLVRCPKITELDLGRGFICDEGGIAVAGAIPFLPLLRTLSVATCGMTSPGVAAVAESLLLAPHILYLDLSHNPIGDDGALRLAAAFPPTLEELVLSSCKVGSVGAVALGTALQQLLLVRRRTRLRPCAATTSLRTLRLDHNDIGIAGANSLFLATNSANSRLALLDLNRNGMMMMVGMMEGSTIVGPSRHSSLVTLRLDFNRLGDPDIESLVQDLGHNDRLETLILSNNKIGDTGAAALAVMLDTNRTLKQLDLTCNPSIGTRGGMALSGPLHKNSPHAALEELSLAMTGIDETCATALLGAKTLQRLLLHNTALCFPEPDSVDAHAIIAPFLEALRACEIRCIDLSYNRLDTRVAVALAETLRANENKFEELALDHNDLTGEGVDCLAEAMHHNESLQQLSVTASDGRYHRGAHKINCHCERNRRTKKATNNAITAVEALIRTTGAHSECPEQQHLPLASIPHVLHALHRVAPDGKGHLFSKYVLYGVFRGQPGGESKLWMGLRRSLVRSAPSLDEEHSMHQPTAKKCRMTPASLLY